MLKAWRMKLNYLGEIKDMSALDRYLSNDRHQSLQVITIIMIGKVPAILEIIQKESSYVRLSLKALDALRPPS